MSDTVISFTTIEFPNEEFFEKYGELYVDVKFNAYRGQIFQDWS